jgi:hypothetical protein
MGFLNFGAIKGLSHGHDFGRDIDRLYDRERYAMEVRKERENKARYYGELLQEQQATTPYNTRRLENYYDELTGELADFVVANPNFETDINLQREFQNIAGRFQDNDIIREDAQVAQALEALKQETLSGEMDGDDYMIEMDRYQEYANNGGNPYVFENFKKVYLNEVVSQLAQVVGKDLTTVKSEDGLQVLEIEAVNPTKLDYTARMALTRTDYDRTVEKAWRKAKGSGMYENKLDFFKKIISAQINYGSKFVAWDKFAEIDARTRATMQTQFNENNVVFGSYILENLYGEDRQVTGDNRHIVFTPWRTKNALFNPGQYYDNDTGGTYKTLLLNTLKKGEGDPDYISANIHSSIQATGAGRLFLNEHGDPFAEVNVNIPIIEGQNEDLRAVLDKYGWSSKKYSQLGQVESALGTVQGITQTSDVYQGTIVVPATFEDSQIHDYERGFKTDTKAMERQSSYSAYSQYAKDLAARSRSGAQDHKERVLKAETAVSRLGTTYPNVKQWVPRRSKKNEDILVSDDGKIYYNVDTGETVDTR